MPDVVSVFTEDHKLRSAKDNTNQAKKMIHFKAPEHIALSSKELGEEPDGAVQCSVYGKHCSGGGSPFIYQKEKE